MSDSVRVYLVEAWTSRRSAPFRGAEVSPENGCRVRSLRFLPHCLPRRGKAQSASSSFSTDSRRAFRAACDPSRTRLSLRELPRLSRRLAGAECAQAIYLLSRLRDRGIFLEEFRKLLRHDVVNDRSHLGISELRLRLAFKLRVRQLHRNHRAQSLARVLAGEILVGILQRFRFFLA